MNLVSKPTENQFNSRGQDVLPLTFRLFPQRSDSVDNRAPPSNNGLQRHLSQQDIVNPPDSEILDFQTIPTSPFRLFGSTTSVSNSNPVKKHSATDKVRRKRAPKTDDNSDGQKVKRRKSDMNMSQSKQQQTEPVVSTMLLQSSAEKKYSTETNKNVANYREIGFSPASSAQSDSCSNSNHTSESSSISTVNSKLTQTEITGSINSASSELDAKNSQIQSLTR
ncbi:unnamed protein product, partial [Adineta ricciae]